MTTRSSSTMVVTGANTGIGYETALALSGKGARVLVHARSEMKARETVEALAAAAASVSGREAGPLVPVWGDFASLDQVESLAEQILSQTEHLEVLVNNAGAVFSPRQESEDGYELTFAVNHLAPFLLTHRLLDRLKASAPARIVTVASAAHQRSRLDLEDLQSTRGYSMFTVYGNSKLANILFTRELSRRLRGSKVSANCLHPGVVFTHFGRDGDAGSAFDWLMARAKPFLLTPQKGARTSIYLASSEEVEGISGEYFIRCRRARSSRKGRDLDLAAALWGRTEALLSDRL